MADYTVTTTDEQEVSLEYAYTYYGTGGETKDQFLQRRVNSAVLDPMVLSQKSDAQIAFQQSIATVPEENKPQATQEIKDVIVANGGTVFPAQPALSPIAIAERVTRGTLPAVGGTLGSHLQAGAVPPPSVAGQPGTSRPTQ